MRSSLYHSLALLLLTLPWSAGADLEQAFQAYQRGDYEAAIAAWQPLAEQGDPIAQFNLGQMYRLGKGVPQSDREAVKWYALAAKQGSSHAQHNLRLLYRDGRATREEYEAVFNAADEPVEPVTPVAAVEPSEPVVPEPPAAAESTAEPAEEKEEPAATLAAAAPATSVADAAPQDWLQQLNPQDYLVQLLATPTQESLDGFLADHRASIPPDAKTARTTSKGREWHVLLLGPFSSRADAQAAIEKLPAAFNKNEPWIRQVSSVQAIAR
jgi:outer membrane biosynthesis protein TonB